METVSEFEFEKLLEEIETLRASNGIKQGNIELLETENERLKTELLCLTYDRDALLAERDDILKRKPADELAENGDMYADAYCQIVDMIEPYVKRGFNDSGELPASVVHSVEFLFEFWIKHKAGREAMMKQEIVAWKHTERDDVIHSKVKCLVEEAYKKYGASSSVQRSPVNKAERYSIPLYASPLPAQQIPEVTPEMLRVAQTQTELGAIACANYSGGYSLITELFEKMLSASQQKGDV